jgi:hypothetical protein
MLKINTVTMEEKIKEILVKYHSDGDYLLKDATKELLNLFNVTYSVFDHKTIQRIRNSQSDAEVRRLIINEIKKL